MFKKSSRQRLFYVVIITLLVSLSLQPKAYSQGDPSEKIESDDSRITRAGEWHTQASTNASGGSYLYNTASAGLRPAQNPEQGASEPRPYETALSLNFEGSSIEVIYVSGPTLGTLAIEIDGTVLRTVITTAEKTAYGQVAKIDYLADGPHELKVYAQEGGVVGVDAFITSPPDHPLAINVEGEEDGGIQATFCSPTSTIHRVSFTSNGSQTNNQSDRPAISADGRFVAFSSVASLVPGDGDSTADIYVYDRQTCTTQLVSVSSAGVKSNGTSDDTSISADGRFIAFESIASNLVANDTNARLDMFIHDRVLGTTIRASVATGNIQHNGLVAHNGVISGNGRYIAFTSDASNLVTGDNNGNDDIFVFDRQTNTTTRVSVVTGGGQSNGSSFDRVGISHDGNFVGFASLATNLVAGDTNSQFDVFVHDRNLSITTRVSVATGGIQVTGGQSFLPTFSSDGRFVAFLSESPNVVAGDTNGETDAFVHDRQTNTTTRVSVGPGGSQMTGDALLPQISGNGQFVLFHSQASNLVAGDTNGTFDEFVHDRQTGITSRVSLTSTGGEAVSGPVDGSGAGSITPDGRYIVFESLAANLVAGDTNGFQDIFVTPRVQPVTDKLALLNPTFESVVLLDTLNDNPPAENYTFFSAYTPITGGQWVMGDWNGDGLKTPGVYNNGPFFYTNKSGESQPSDWQSLWIGVVGVPVSGRFNGELANDCIGAVQTASLGGQTVFVLYFTCDLSGNTLPTISNQWLSAVLPDAGGFSGTHQFKSGDFNSDGVDSIAVRRGTFIAFGNVAPVTGPAGFDLAQFIGTPQAGADAGIFVVGDWDASGADSFGLFYQNGEFFYRNDLTFNSGVYVNQSIGTPFAGTVQATIWR